MSEPLTDRQALEQLFQALAAGFTVDGVLAEPRLVHQAFQAARLTLAQPDRTEELQRENSALLLDRNELLAHYQRSSAESLNLKAKLAASEERANGWQEACNSALEHANFVEERERQMREALERLTGDAHDACIREVARAALQGSAPAEPHSNPDCWVCKGTGHYYQSDEKCDKCFPEEPQEPTAEGR